jgi:putative transposase
VLREVVVGRSDKPGDPLVLLTNDLARPAHEIAALCKERWDIELLFKWLKQNLKIRSFWGRSENAVRIQIYVALIAFLLLRLLHHGAARACKAGTALLLTQIKIALFAPRRFTHHKTPPPRPPAWRPPIRKPASPSNDNQPKSRTAVGAGRDCGSPGQ